MTPFTTPRKAMARKTPLRRSPLNRYAPIARTAFKRGRSNHQAARQKQWNAINGRKRAAGVPCEFNIAHEGRKICDGNPRDGHHWLPKRWGEWNEANHKWLCSACHRFIHANPKLAYAMRWILRVFDAPVECIREKFKVLSPANGGAEGAVE